MHLDAEVLLRSRGDIAASSARGSGLLSSATKAIDLGGDLVAAPGARAGSAEGRQGRRSAGRSGPCSRSAGRRRRLRRHRRWRHRRPDGAAPSRSALGPGPRASKNGLATNSGSRTASGWGLSAPSCASASPLGSRRFALAMYGFTRFVNINMPLLLACQMLCRRYMQHYCRYNRSHAQDALRAAASFSLRMRHNCLYASFGPRHAPSRSSNSHRVIKSIVRNAALPPAIRRNSSAGARSVNAVEIVRSRASSPA